MRIKRLQIDGFGKLVNKQFDFPGQLNLVMGANEAGKSTLIHCILGVLYGFKRQKKLLEKYAPWQAPVYQAALLVVDGKGVEHTISRDFGREKVEIFREVEGRMIPEAESILQEQILQEAGLVNSHIFESTLFIRQTELANLSQDKISEAISKKITASDDEVSTRDALRQIENKIKDYTRKGQANPGILTEAEQKEEKLRAQMQGFQDYFIHYENKIKARQEVSQNLQEKQKRFEDLKPLVEGYYDRQQLNERKAELNKKLTDIIEKIEKAEKLKAQEPQLEEQIENLGINKEEIPEGKAAVLEDLEQNLQRLGLEKNLKVEQKWQHLSEIEELQQELKQTQEKMLRYNPEFYSTENIARASYLQSFIRDKQALLSDNEKKKEEMKKNLSKGRLLSSFIYAAAVLIGFLMLAYVFLNSGQKAFPLFISLDEKSLWVVGLSSILFYFLVFIRLWKKNREKSLYHRLQREIHSLTEEMEVRKNELIEITKDTDPDEYLREVEKIRFLQNDIWHLEHTLAQHENSNIDQEYHLLEQEEAETRKKLEQLLAEAGCKDYNSFQTKAHRFKELNREKQVIQEKMDYLLEEKNFDEWRKEKLNLAAECVKVDSLLEKIKADIEPGPMLEMEGEFKLLQEDVYALQERLKELDNDIRNYRELVLPRDSWELAGELAEAVQYTKKCHFEVEALQKALDVLQEASMDVTSQMGPDLERNTARLLAHMTNNKYNEAKLAINNEGLQFSITSPERKQPVNPDDLSTGTRDQIYLAVRIALSQSILGGAHFPVFLDDPFVHFDEDRLDRTLKMLQNLSEKFQIIWLSKDERMITKVPGANVILI